MKPSIALRRLLLILADPALGMYSPKTIDGCKHRPVGTGPFKVKEGGSKSPEYVLLEKNHDYWGELPRLDEIRFSSVLEDITRISMLMEGEAHVATRVPPGPAKQLQERLDTHVRAVSSTKTVYIGMNIRKEPFKDKRVRQAVNYCVDKEEIVDIILFGFGHVSDAPIAPTIFGYQQIGDYPYDPEKGKALLEEAGYKDGFETTLLAPDVYPLVHVAYAVQAYLEKCDIRARVFVLEWVALLDMLRGEEHEMFLLFQTPLIRDAHHALFPVFHSTGSWNRTFYENPAVDELLKRAETELDEEARIELYREAMEIIWEDAPWLFLYTPYILTGVREEVKGLIIYPDGRIDASKAWIEEIEA
jgi:peptide/nickel transport system substrate-binding protein